MQGSRKSLSVKRRFLSISCVREGKVGSLILAYCLWTIYLARNARISFWAWGELILSFSSSIYYVPFCAVLEEVVRIPLWHLLALPLPLQR